MAQDLDRRLTALGFVISRDAHGNLLASEEGSDPLMLSAHMDTVEPGRGIKPRIVGDEVHTDGTTILGGDCKAGVAAILEALESLKEDGTPRIPVQLVFTRGEEIGLVGAWNLDFSMVQAKQAVVFDGNGPVNTVITASPTYIGFDVRVTGRSAHAGVEPEKGLSAIRIAADIIGKPPPGSHGRRDHHQRRPHQRRQRPQRRARRRPSSPASSAAATPRPWSSCDYRSRTPSPLPEASTRRPRSSAT